MTKKLILPPSRDIFRLSDTKVVPAIDQLTSEIKLLIANEVAKYAAKSFANPLPLDNKATKAIRDLTESLCKLTREAREQARSEDLSSLSNEELVELALKLAHNKETVVKALENPTVNGESEENED
jgi:hypothetical protein